MAEVKLNASPDLRIENEIMLDSLAKVVDEKQYEQEIKIIKEELYGK